MQCTKIFDRALRIAFLLVCCTSAHAADGDHAGMLHVPSPDWRDQIIYFVMTDRFDDGNAANNDQGAGEFDPADGAKYSGGDLAGIERRIGYIRDLGATAVWITPPVANQWWDAGARFSGYHGYWAENFVEVDRHLGTLADYQRLSRRLHAEGLYLVQDIVVNHVGNFFSYPDKYDSRAPQRRVRLNTDARPHGAPTQRPFSLNDVGDPAQRASNIYHWTPSIREFDNVQQQHNWQLADLDDLNTENPQVRKALRASYGYWIREVGVDAFRVDTAFYVPPDYFQDFLRADDADAPGILRVAAQTGRQHFHLFGEGFGIDRAFSDVQARRIDSYMRDEHGRERLPGMLNFPLYGSMLDVFARGAPSAVLGHRISNMMQLHADPWRMPSFVDNHDVDRFLATGNEPALRQALLTIMTLPGIPVIYYGTEQGFSVQRAAMFKGGFGADGHDHFDADAPLYRYVQRITNLRRSHRVLSRGAPSVIDDNHAAAGALAWRMSDGNEHALIVLNSAAHETLLTDVDTGLAAGMRLQPVFSIDGKAEALQVDANGRLTLRLAANSGQVWIAAGVAEVAEVGGARIDVDAIPTQAISGDLQVRGTASGVSRMHVLIDGDLGRARIVEPAHDGRWRATIDTSDLIDPALEHRVVAWSDQPMALSPAQRFHVERTWRLAADVEDPKADDRGPRGRYRYPDDPVWRAHRSIDLRRVRVWTSAGSLRIEVQMRELIATWNPANGFDHLALTIYLQLPDRADGQRVMPLQNANLPEAMRWHYRLRANGWTNALTAFAGASATNEGTPVMPAADLRVDRSNGSISFSLPASAIGGAPTMDGARLHVTTWDYDGRYRPLAIKPGSFEFGGGDGARDPLVMDDSAVITLHQ